MFFLSRKKRKQELNETIARAERIEKPATLKEEKAIKEAEKLNKLLERANRDKDATLRMFLAMGGDRRIKQ